MRHLVCLFVCLFAFASVSEAATRTVCASGCQYTSLQQAIDEAVPGDTILLRAGETYVGNFRLRAKGGTSTAFITIKSDAPASSLPPAGVRLVPSGKPGGNTQRSALARLLGQSGTYKSTPVIRAGAGAHHYRLQFLEIDGAANVGYETLISIGANDSTQTTAAQAPHAIVLDRIWAHGHPLKGMKRGIAANGRSIDILNSYIDDVFSVSDSQAIAGFNGPGPVRVINNFLEAAGENILFGGADPRIPNLVPSDIEIRGNHFYKDPSWRNPILAAPAKPSLRSTTGGSLAAGTHYFAVVAVLSTGGSIVVSAGSPAAPVTVGSRGAVVVSWPSVNNAEKYRVYRGTAAGTMTNYLETSSTSMTYTGAAEKTGSPKTAGHRWTSKNHLELKNGQRVTIDGNLFENNWAGFQNGYAILFTPKNQDGAAPWTAVRDVVFSNNVLRHSAAGVAISGYDWQSITQRLRNVRILNNVFEDIGVAWGGKGALFLLASGPADIVIDHNTILHEGPLLEIGGATVPGFVYRNNFSRHNRYGLKGQDHAVGIDTLNTYFPGFVFARNVLAGGPAGSYPTGNYFPTTAEFTTSFVNGALGDYTLVTTSPFVKRATDGRDIGVDTRAMRLAQAAQVTGVVTPPSPPEPEPPPTPETLPEGWQSEDVGAVGVTGAASAGSGRFVVRGEGANVWGTADALHFAYRPLSGDGTIVARVASHDGETAWAKVGVMIRAGTDAGSAHAFMLVSGTQGLAFQRRKSNGGSSVHTSGGAGTAPRWVKLTRTGNTIAASSSIDGRTWVRVATDTFSMPDDVLVGLASHSHDPGTLVTATFDNVSVSSGQALPAGWESNDVGSVGTAGAAAHNAGTFTVRGAGADIWGTADAFHYAWRPLATDGEIVARIATVSGSDAWTKAGVMMRQTLDAGSAQALMAVSAGHGVRFQRRTVTGGTSLDTNGGAGAAPEWVKLTRAGQLITASVSSDGTTWREVGRDTFSMVGEIHVGLAVTSHGVSAPATATFDNVAITAQ